MRSGRSKTKSNLLEHLSLLEMEVYFSENTEIQHPKEIKSAYVFQSLPFDMKKNAIVFFLNEILINSVREHEANPPFFQFIYDTIIELDTTKESVASFHLYFMLRISRFLGFFPALNYSEGNCIFNLNEGKFQPVVPVDEDYLPPRLSGIFFRFISSPEKEFQLSYAERTLLLEKLIAYFRIHLPGFREVKSLPVLKTVLN
jgi:DNA repair protein RecO (recombination protein O)